MNKLGAEMSLDIAAIREEFPSLSLMDAGKPRIYLDNPAGTQVPIRVIAGISKCLLTANANLGGDFTSSRLAAQMTADARSALADFLGAQPHEITFGANMTTLTLHLSRSLAETWGPGDEIILSRMDHDANVWPWVMAARDAGATIKWLDFDAQRYEFSIQALDDLLSKRTKFLAFGYASNLLGTINPVKEFAAKARDVGALTFVDAVHYAPHGLIDVAALGCDFLTCSVYKFFGPHIGVLWSRAELLEKLEPYKLRPAPDLGGERFETGTQNHECLAGSLAAIEYIESLGDPRLNTRRARISSAMDRIAVYERDLTWRLINGLLALPGITIHGVTNPSRAAWRAPTVSFTHEKLSPQHLAKALADEGICAWAGHSYAIEPVTQLGLMDKGGVLRLGIAHYNTAQEIDTTLDVIKRQVISPRK